MTFTIARLLLRQKDDFLRRFRGLFGIPKIERKLSKGKKLSVVGCAAEPGVLIQDPVHTDRVRLMLSENPYHWRFEKI